jgi:hypothetical protein
MAQFFARQDYEYSFFNNTSVADMNGDGIPDLIFGTCDGPVWVQLGAGDGTFPTSILNSQGLCETQIFPIDLNGDGKIDLVFGQVTVGFGDASGVAVSLGNGDGTLQSPSFYQIRNDAFGSVGYAGVADFNGDGRVDIIAGDDSGIYLLTGNGDGTFNSPELVVTMSLQNPFLQVADFNLDGKPDLAVSSCCGTDGVFVLLGNGDGTFQSPISVSSTLSGNLAVGPLTKGGPPGIVVPAGNTLELFFGDGNGGFSGPSSVAPGGTNHSVAIADVNGDGLPDLVTITASIAFGLGNGQFGDFVSYNTAVNSSSTQYNVVVAPLTSNGRQDIVVTGSNPAGLPAVSVLLNLGHAKMEDGVFTAATADPNLELECGVSADFNGDGKPDLLVTTPNGVLTLLGTGKALSPFTFGSGVDLQAQTGCVNYAVDLNGDGILDLLVPTQSAVITLLGNGDGSFRVGSSTPVAETGYGLVVADFNQDGKLDFATTGNLLALGNGDGTFQKPQQIVPEVTQPFLAMAAGDVNNDGWPDLVIYVSDNDAMTFLNNHNGTFSSIQDQLIGPSVAQLALVDINGDGFLDLIANGWIFFGNGTGQYEIPNDTAGPVNGTFTLGDFNGDGIIDMAGLGSLNSISVGFGNGDGSFVVLPYNIGAGSAPHGLVAMDAHGQTRPGFADLVSPSTGGVMTLLNITKGQGESDESR